jgi:hypothetical protein
VRIITRGANAVRAAESKRSSAASLAEHKRDVAARLAARPDPRPHCSDIGSKVVVDERPQCGCTPLLGCCVSNFRKQRDADEMQAEVVLCECRPYRYDPATRIVSAKMSVPVPEYTAADTVKAKSLDGWACSAGSLDGWACSAGSFDGWACSAGCFDGWRDRPFPITFVRHVQWLRFDTCKECAELLRLNVDETIEVAPTQLPVLALSARVGALRSAEEVFVSA